MDLESLLNASVALEKRIQTDKLLRRYLASVWGPAERTAPGPEMHSKPNPADPRWRKVTLTLREEMCELIEIAAQATGKTPSQILEESFVEFFVKNVSDQAGDHDSKPKKASVPHG